MKSLGWSLTLSKYTHPRLKARAKPSEQAIAVASRGWWLSAAPETTLITDSPSTMIVNKAYRSGRWELLSRGNLAWIPTVVSGVGTSINSPMAHRTNRVGGGTNTEITHSSTEMENPTERRATKGRAMGLCHPARAHITSTIVRATIVRQGKRR